MLAPSTTLDLQFKQKTGTKTTYKFKNNGLEALITFTFIFAYINMSIMRVKSDNIARIIQIVILKTLLAL
jgi:hypothetical protein